MRITGRLCSSGTMVSIEVAEGRIARIQEVAGGGSSTDAWIAPGFCDIQINGYGGWDFNRGQWSERRPLLDALLAVRDACARAGVALFCPTLVTNSHEAIHGSLDEMARALDGDASLSRSAIGFHLEGPYIAAEDGPRGAHPLEHVRDPDWDEFQRFQDAAGGRIRICTLAPERPGAFDFIARLVGSGVVAAIGHTAAPPPVIRDAARAGATLSTHLGNGAHGQIARHPNYIWEQLAEDSLSASLILDGHHLPAAVMKSMVRAKGADRVALVSDAVSLGGLPAGVYNNGLHEVLPSGKVVLAGTPYLAGAGHLMDVCLANALRSTDLSMAAAVSCASAVPARILGTEQRKGHIRIGSDGDFTLFRMDSGGALVILATVCAGEMVYAGGEWVRE